MYFFKKYTNSISVDLKKYKTIRYVKLSKKLLTKQTGCGNIIRLTHFETWISVIKLFGQDFLKNGKKLLTNGLKCGRIKKSPKKRSGRSER